MSLLKKTVHVLVGTAILGTMVLLKRHQEMDDDQYMAHFD
ncbi:hypothetical protein OURE66S_01790 [Oligella ureolytica]